MDRYHAIKGEQLSIGQGPNGYGRRYKITGAYVVSPEGRRCRAFTDREGGLAAAEAWALILNERRFGQ